jgi:hypothetical protein
VVTLVPVGPKKVTVEPTAADTGTIRSKLVLLPAADLGGKNTVPTITPPAIRKYIPPASGMPPEFGP